MEPWGVCTTCFHSAHVGEITERSDESVLDIGEKLYAEIHLQESETHLHALRQGRAHVAPAAFRVRVAAAPYLGAPSMSEKRMSVIFSVDGFILLMFILTVRQ